MGVKRVSGSNSWTLESWQRRLSRRILCVRAQRKLVSSSPLCSKTADFYKAPGKIRYKIIQIRATAENPCIFYGQKACGCRHSAVICLISIPSPAKHGTKLVKSETPHIIPRFLRSKCMMMPPLCGRFHNFYTVSHKTRYKVRLIRATTHNHAFFPKYAAKHRGSHLALGIGLNHPEARLLASLPACLAGCLACLSGCLTCLPPEKLLESSWIAS